MKNVRLLKIVSLAMIASLIFLSVPITAQPPSTADFVDQVAAVEAALTWLRTQQQADGSFQAAFGSTTGATIDALFAIAASGGNPHAWSVAEGPSIIDYLADQATVYATESTATAAKLALAAISVDENPSAFEGLDLAAILAASYDAGTGLYGLGLADQMWAMLATAALGQEVPQAAADWLAAQQQADGGFDAAGWGTDTDTTSLAIEAMIAAGQPVPEISTEPHRRIPVHQRLGTGFQRQLHRLQHARPAGGRGEPPGSALDSERRHASGRPLELPVPQRSV